MEIVRTSAYQSALKRLLKRGATDADIEAMETAIATSPERGDIIPGTNGLRKLRFGLGGKGKRGGGRTVYFALTRDGVIYLLTAYSKADREDITASEKKLFAALVKELTHD